MKNKSKKFLSTPRAKLKVQNSIVVFFLLLTFDFFLLCPSSSAQQNKIDSLLTLLKTDKEDTNKVNHLNDLSWEYQNIEEYQSGIAYAQKAYQLANNIHFQKPLPKSLLAIGSAYFSLNQDSSIAFYLKTIKCAEDIKDTFILINAYKCISLIYRGRSDYISALNYSLQSLKLSENKKAYRGVSINSMDIGHIYIEQKDYTNAIKYYHDAVKYAYMDNNNPIMLVNGYMSIGNIYNEKNNYDSALFYYNKSLKIAEEKNMIYSKLYNYNNISELYLKKQNYNEVLKYSQKIIGDSAAQEDKILLSSTFLIMGKASWHLNQKDNSLQYFLKASTIAKEIDAKNIMKESYLSLADYYAETNNFKSAYAYYKLLSEVKDSIYNADKTKQLSELLTKYETEKKDNQIKLLNTEKEKERAIAEEKSRKQKIITYSVAGGLFLVIVFAGFIFRSLRITKKQKRELNIKNTKIEGAYKIITQQKEEVEKQREEIAHKNKDLTDSINYAQRIQAAILTSEQYLNDMFLPQGQTASHFILYKPKDIVAGDFYWAYQLPPSGGGGAIWVTADCTGHGVPGAFMSMIGNSLLNEIVVEKGIHEPDEILNRMRAGVIKALGQSGGDKKKDGMDAALCCWDKTKNKISFSGANNSLWIVRKNLIPDPSPQEEKGVQPATGPARWSPLTLQGEGQGVRFFELEPDIQPIGHYLETNKPFTKKEFQLQAGDALYTFTDGYCDQFGGPKGKKFKYKPFRELLISIQDKSMSEQKEILNRTIDEWRGTLEQIDDICVFGVRV